MDKIFAPLHFAIKTENGHALAQVFSPVPSASDPTRLHAIAHAASSFTVQPEMRSFIKHLSIDNDAREVWLDILLNFWKSTVAITEAEEAHSNITESSAPPDDAKVYNTWKTLLNSLHRAYSQSHLEPWTLPLLYIVTSHLRKFAIAADRRAASDPPTTHQAPSLGAGLDDIASTDPAANQANLEDCARQINRIFALVTQDRSPAPNRKYGTYYIAVLLFKTYFRLHSLSLCKNIIRTIDASAIDLPPLASFPKSHRVGYAYFSGVVDFLDERYHAAEEKLSLAWGLCPAGELGRAHAERILTYLIPTKLFTRQRLPSRELLARHPRLEALFGPLCVATKRGDTRAFDEALAKGESQFVKLRVYLTLERARDVCLRNLLRKVYLAAGLETTADGGQVRRSRISLAEFAAAFRVVGDDAEDEEVECLIAGIIYKVSNPDHARGTVTDPWQGLMKGYISRAHLMVVLYKKGAFPDTGV